MKVSIALKELNLSAKRCFKQHFRSLSLHFKDLKYPEIL